VVKVNKKGEGGLNFKADAAVTFITNNISPTKKS
jgi:hypothetical protein